jgi:hypothetical protein
MDLEPMADDLDAAAADARRLADAISSQEGSLQPVYDWLEHSLVSLEAEGYRPADLLPATAEPGLGFSLRQTRDGKTLWQVIAASGRESLCSPDGELRKRLDASGTGKASAASVLASVLVALGLPLVAVPFAVSLTAVILAIGVTSLCEWMSLPRDEPGAR